MGTRFPVSDMLRVMARSDDQLLDETKRGGADAFGALFERHADAVYNFCFRRTGDWSVAEDLTAVVFLEGWRHRQTVVLDGRDSLLPWLLGVATNVLRNQRRSVRRNRRALERIGAERATQDFADDAAGRLSDAARVRELLPLFEALPQRERDVLGLCVLGDLDYEQAALALGIPGGTVRSRLSRAKARLRELDAARPVVAQSLPPINDGV